MMDLPTKITVIHLQLQDVRNVLTNPTIAADERSAFEAMRTSLLSQLRDINRCLDAHRLLGEENANLTTFARLVTEELQARNDHDIAHRLTERPEPALSSVATADSTHTTRPRPIAAPVTSVHPLPTSNATVSISSTQLSSVQPRPVLKRPAAEELIPEAKVDSSGSTREKRLRLDADITTTSSMELRSGSSTHDTLQGLTPPVGNQSSALGIPRAPGPIERPVDENLSIKSEAATSVTVEPRFRHPSMIPPRPLYKNFSRSEDAPNSTTTGPRFGQPSTIPPRSLSKDLVRNKDAPNSTYITVHSKWSPAARTNQQSSQSDSIPGVGTRATGFVGRDSSAPSIATVSNSGVPTAHGTDESPARELGVTCISCLETLSRHDATIVDCKLRGKQEQHSYCLECLKRLIETSLSDSALFPPRCCSEPIPLLSTLDRLPSELRDRFLSKEKEHNTRDKIYCSSASCSQWIPQDSIEAGVATCGKCHRETCVVCKSDRHKGLCPEEKGTEMLMSVAKKEKWQTCPQCKNMVQLESGCYHITCRCKQQFCYLCAAKWKTCRCQNADPEHLIVDGIEDEDSDDDSDNGNDSDDDNSDSNGELERDMLDLQRRVQDMERRTLNNDRNGVAARVARVVLAPRVATRENYHNSGGDSNEGNSDAYSDYSDDYQSDYEAHHIHHRVRTFTGRRTCDRCRDRMAWIMACTGCGSRLCRSCARHDSR